MGAAVVISPQGHLRVRPAETSGEKEAFVERVLMAFQAGAGPGLLHLAARELETRLPLDLVFLRSFASRYLTDLCRQPAESGEQQLPEIEPPAPGELASLILQAPPMTGLEYLRPDTLRDWWRELDQHVRVGIRNHPGGVREYLRERNPVWRMVGRVTFHLAENKKDPERPFAFLATYTSRVSAQGKLQHLPLSRALAEYSGAGNRTALLSLLSPVQTAAERSPLVRQMLDDGDLYHPLAWSPAEAYAFLKETPALEESGVIVRIPDWWKRRHASRPVVNVTVGDRGRAQLDLDALLDFSVDVTLDGRGLTAAELRELLQSEAGLVRLRGQWVEVDPERLRQAMDHWNQVKETAADGLSFIEGMRLLAGADIAGSLGAAPDGSREREWVGIQAGDWLRRTLEGLRDPSRLSAGQPPGLQTALRPYQQTGAAWLDFVTGLGLGACLADDMGLGKTIQVLALLLAHRDRREMDEVDGVDEVDRKEAPGQVHGRLASLLIVPASLIANWKSEIDRFAPEITYFVAHPSENRVDREIFPEEAGQARVVITTYSMLARLNWLSTVVWPMVILDEAQAIKNAGSRQSRQARALQAKARVALTGTPVENRLGDLWSLFDFLNPGLLGSSRQFSTFIKSIEDAGRGYGPLRSLVQPYILRRLKTDGTVISDLPDKTEVKAFCLLSRRQTALYTQTLNELARSLQRSDGIERKGIVLATLMRLKQICNHPAQATGDGDFDPRVSGKFERLWEICEELAERQQKVLIFTQFREMCDPLEAFLAGVFNRRGLVLHGSTRVAERRRLVEEFQREEGPPFFVLSLKAGGTGLNLTAASNVVHFDRWWNPAVENQATDRAFRIGQNKNVLVHKFVCQGTVEERIDAMIEGKSRLAEDVIEGGAERILTEMGDQELLQLLSLDINRATVREE
jgi:non-specific serine/threonine protein kinase